jgi:phosphatidylinositol alpha-1,6-mannosyltransferase
VAGNSGGAGEAVANGETGFVVANPDAAAAGAALARLLDDAELRRTLGEGARRRAEAEFSYDVLAARLDDTLQRVEASTL